ncbi:MAG: nitrate- and nitrite sensing domain-containing protein [Acidimicrobiales bacterium]|jgi:signal transduction histidine kinase|nr:nitrate- and nitrite sensing domain-containing protein [Acidimicrobiales bacterium]
MLRNLKVGTKLMATLVAPALVIVVLVTIGVRDRLDVARSANSVEEVAGFAAATSTLADQLQIEAVRSVNVSGSQGAVGAPELAAQRAATDTALAEFEDAAERSGAADLGGAVSDSLRFAEARLGTLGTLRTSVDTGQVLPYAIGQSYSDSVDALGAVTSALVQTANDAELLRGLETVAALDRISVAQGALAVQTVGAARVGQFTDRTGQVCATFGTECDSFVRAEEANGDLQQTTDAFSQGRATPAEKQLVQNAQAANQFEELAQRTLDEGVGGNVITVPADELTAASLAAVDGLSGVSEVLTANVASTASDLASNAFRGALLYLVAGIGALVLAFGLAVVVARSVTRPLNRLTGAAYRLSTEQLPSLVEQLRNPDDEASESVTESLEAIPVDSTDEIGQLAEAFNSIQTVTVDVAEEQSRLLRKGIGDIFVHLARRNQSLLDRQIEFIDHLETHEQDPDQLDNLFKLDHLATRMRRNAESLLVLAGAEPPRRRGRPVPVVDVVRVAIGEVEDFSRVHLIALDDATIAGNVAVDLAHLLSELMENATHFSPPESSVEVLGRRGDRNGYVLTVADRGIGMNAQQLAEANAQLARPPLVGLALSRSLGFIVIGRLANRFGLTVTLEPTPNGGTTATVTLPFSLVEYPEDGETTPSTGRSTTRGATPTKLLPAGRVERPGGTDGAARSAGPLVRRSAPAAPTSPVPAPSPAAVPEPATVGASGLPARRASVGAPAPSPVTDSAPSVSAPDSAAPALTAAGLVRRTPKAATATPTSPVESAATAARPVARSSRSPEEVRRMLSRYRSGLDRGRQGDDTTSTSSDDQA